ncbi:MAG: protein kinase [Archangium sp.]
MAANPSFIAPSSALDRRHLGKYEVLCRLSTGGMSAIYLAHQTGLAGFKKLVVLKTILPDIGGEEDFVGMFLEEARITAVFNHPNIAQVFELDTDEGQLFMAMEFVQGCTLVEMARACRQAKEAIPVGFTLASTRDTALALHYAHNFTDARGRRQIVIHRDVAEKNIMVTYEGVTKLLDFGIAKALGRSGRTSIGMVKGTSGYMSPEQIRGEPLDPRSDVFALGVVMHECLTGLRLFHGKTAEEGMMAALREEVQPPSKWNKEVNAETDAVVLKALQRDREKRFATALEFARAIEKAAPGMLWHPEQSGELVTKHFSDRRAETRRLLESTEFGSETTGEVRVQSVLAKVRASAGGGFQSSDSRPGDTPKKPAPLISAPKVATPQDTDESTRPGVTPGDLQRTPMSNPVQQQATTQRDDQPTNPARPKALRVPSTPGMPAAQLKASSVTAPEPALNRQYSYGDDDDERSDKTIPATALPEEIKNLRAQFAAKRSAATVPAGSAAAQASDLSSTQRDKVLTEKNENSVPRPAPQPPQMPGMPRQSGETISITNKGNAMDWEDDEGVKTAIARPGELPGMAELRALRRPVSQPSNFNAGAGDAPAASQPSLEPLSASQGDLPVVAGMSTQSQADFDAVRPRRTGLILALLVLGALAVLGALVLLDVLPLPKFGAGPRVG